MKVGIPKETSASERRVAIVPASVAALMKAGLDVRVETSAGLAAGFDDDAYTGRGATIVPDRAALYGECDAILQVRTPGANGEGADQEIALLRPGQSLIGFADALTAHDATRSVADRGVSLYAMELMPRTTRAQTMDALSSQANLVGFKSVILAAAKLGKILPMMMTAAGTIQPARVFVVGAGVAGLQAIATAKRLGALVSAFDVRPAVKEQVESLGARFVELPLDTAAAEDKSGYAKAQSDEQIARQREMMARVVAESDIVITTAAVPGKRAPVLIGRDMVDKMAPGSVIVDVAAERGGNCELTRPGETIEHNGVTIIGDDNLPASAAHHASQMYSNNVTNFVKHILKDGRFSTDRSDEIIAGTLVCHDGQIVNKQVRELMGMPPQEHAPAANAGQDETEASE